MKDPTDKNTLDMYEDNEYRDCEATEERLDQTVKEFLWNSKTKQFEPYHYNPPMSYEEWYEKLEEGNK